MVCSVSCIKSAGAASAYYSQTDDYYRDAGHAPTAWHGTGAAALGLAGEVSTEQAESLLQGHLPNGERVGGDDHRPGWDATFSAPKSVSVALYVRGDDRLLAAHDAAVREAIAYLEREAAAARIRENGEIRTDATGSLVVATYRHDTSREGDPQLHTHSVIANVTQSADGQWRSLESKPIYRLQTEAGAVYRASLARELERLGYSIERTQEGKHPGFELREVSQAERQLFSTRSAQIDAELARMGKTRETATAEEKQIAALNTRAAKENLDRGALLAEWREQARDAGHQIDTRPENRPIDGSVYAQRADAALAHAVAHLSERETRFTTRQIVSEARKVGMGGIDDRDIAAAIERAQARGELVQTSTRQFDAITGQKQDGAGFTTQEAQQTEVQMLALAGAGVGATTPITTREGAEAAIARQEKTAGHQFNEAQRSAARAVLTGQDRITPIQGYAGTAKTTSVLAASAAELRAQGYEVVALAPTHSAAKTLGDSIKADSQTVAHFLNARPEAAARPRVYVVDEASMLSARDMARLLDRTQDGHLILVGDVKQLGSVEAGAAFRQLQTESGLKTQVLDQIVRQKNDELRAAVYDAIRGDATAALAKVEVRELETRAERVQAIAQDYSAMGRDDREKTIIIAPGRDDRQEINDAVRAQIKERGELGREVTITALDKRDLTGAEAKRAASYTVGDHLQAARDYQSLGLQKGEAARVVAVDVDRNRLTLESTKGERTEIDPARYSKLQAFEARQMPVAEGDRLVVRENSDRLKNGAVLLVEKVTDTQIHARDDAGRLHKLDASATHKLSHGYAQTAHENQGRTSKTVLIHGESNRVNLQTQQNAYVALSRATDNARIYTDSRERLAEQLGRETGEKETALDRRPDEPFPKSISESDIRNSNPKSISEMDNRFPKQKSEMRERIEARRDASLARAALATRGTMPAGRQVAKDLGAGRARWTADSKGERYLQYKDGRTFHPQMHGRLRETHLNQLATLGRTQKRAVLVDKHLIDFKVAGHRVQAIKTGEKVLISREGAFSKWAGQQKDLMAQRHAEHGRGSVLRQANDAAKSAVLTRAEGWREATLQESIRARIGAHLDTREMRQEARGHLEAKVEVAERLGDALDTSRDVAGQTRDPAPWEQTHAPENVRPLHILESGGEKQHNSHAPARNHDYDR